jgi:hypothetical protein
VSASVTHHSSCKEKCRFTVWLWSVIMSYSAIIMKQNKEYHFGFASTCFHFSQMLYAYIYSFWLPPFQSSWTCTYIIPHPQKTDILICDKHIPITPKQQHCVRSEEGNWTICCIWNTNHINSCFLHIHTILAWWEMKLTGGEVALKVHWKWLALKKAFTMRIQHNTIFTAFCCFFLEEI